MEERTALADLIRRARRRLYLQLAAHALGDACAIFLGGATLALRPEQLTIAVQVHARFAAS